MDVKIYENCLEYETYVALRKSVGWYNFCKEQAETALKNSAYSILVKDEDSPIAMGRVVGDGMCFIIVDVVVRPEYQGKGIGTKIIQTILEHIDANLPSGSRASIQLLSEKGKEDFYVKQGFKVLPHEYCGSGMRKVMYKE